MSELSTISVYMKSGVVFEYECAQEKAREHTSAIAATGYRDTRDGVLTHYLPSEISKIVATNQNTLYSSTIRGT